MIDSALVAMRASNGNVVTISPAVNVDNTTCCWVEVITSDMRETLASSFCHSFDDGWSKLESLLDENE